MYVARISIVLDKSEMSVLTRMSESDCRPPREQLRFLLREEAVRRGLIIHSADTAAAIGHDTESAEVEESHE